MAARRTENGQLVGGVDVGTLALNGVKAFASRHKVISGSYVFGLIILVVAGELNRSSR